MISKLRSDLGTF